MGGYSAEQGQPAASCGDATSVILRGWQLLGSDNSCRDAMVLTGEVNKTRMDREVSSDNIKSKCYIFFFFPSQPGM